MLHGNAAPLPGGTGPCSRGRGALSRTRRPLLTRVGLGLVQQRSAVRAFLGLQVVVADASARGAHGTQAEPTRRHREVDPSGGQGSAAPAQPRRAGAVVVTRLPTAGRKWLQRG